MTDHAHGFRHDFPHLITRRRAIGALGAALAVGPTMAQAACVADAAETAGPYPADGTGRLLGKKPNVLVESGVIREDLRSSFAGLSGTADGEALTLTLQLVNVNANCAPLSGHAIYIWHCDANGLYSLYDQTDQNFLRGVGVTDANGEATFTTIFPGCYPARWPHIHYEVFTSPDQMTSGRKSMLTGQLAFAETDCKAVYSRHAAYRTGLANLARNAIATDFEFRDDSAAQTSQRTVAIQGTGQGSVMIGVKA